jgi:hypothetical protein
MSLTGGKRKVNKSLKAWVAFVKKVQKEEKLSYKDAIHRAKVRKDKGEKWMKGGADDDEAMEVKEKKTTTPDESNEGVVEEATFMEEEETPQRQTNRDALWDDNADVEVYDPDGNLMGGRRRRRSMRRRRSARRGRTMRRRRASRRH